MADYFSAGGVGGYSWGIHTDNAEKPCRRTCLVRRQGFSIFSGIRPLSKLRAWEVRLNVCRMTCLVLKTKYFQACFYYHGVADRVCLLILQSVLVQVLTAYLGSLSKDYRYGIYIGMTGFFSRIEYLKIIICLTICLYFTRAVADRNYKCVFATFFINPVNFLPCPV